MRQMLLKSVAGLRVQEKSPNRQVGDTSNPTYSKEFEFKINPPTGRLGMVQIQPLP
jgi:hypothetical protein